MVELRSGVPEEQVKGVMKLARTGEAIGQGDERGGVEEGHFVEQFGGVMEGVEVDVSVEKNVLGEEVQRGGSLENVAVEALP